MKAKNDIAKRHRLKTTSFISIWLSAHVLGWWGIFWLFENINALANLPDLATAVLIGFVPGIVISLMQKYLLRYAFQTKLGGWLRVSLLGWILGGLAMFGVTTFITGPFVGVAMFTMNLFVLPAVAQYFILRRHVNAAWLWVLAGLVSALAFAIPVEASQINNEFLGIILAGSLQGAVTGLTLLWLFVLSARTSQSAKSKNHNTAFQGRRQRLSDYAGLEETNLDAAYSKTISSYSDC